MRNLDYQRGLTIDARSVPADAAPVRDGGPIEPLVGEHPEPAIDRVQ